MTIHFNTILLKNPSGLKTFQIYHTDTTIIQSILNKESIERHSFRMSEEST